MSNLSVYITGLCAFVPRYELDTHRGANQMRLLLVESNSPSDLPGGHMSHAHEPHIPVLLCSSKEVDPDLQYRQPDMIYEGAAVFYLDDQDVRIKGAIEERLEVALEVGAGFGCPDGANNQSFEWVASFATASPGSEDVPDSCLGASDVDPSVIARVELREGRISSDRLGCDSEGQAILWEFKPPYSPKRGRHCQVSADVVRFDVYIKDAVELVTSPLRGKLSNVRVEHAFRRKSELSIRLTGANIEVWIKNMPWADILGTREPQRYEKEPDIHFSHFYKLSSKYESVNVPHPRGRCHVPFPHSGNPNCQPVRTAPNPKA